MSDLIEKIRKNLEGKDINKMTEEIRSDPSAERTLTFGMAMSVWAQLVTEWEESGDEAGRLRLTRMLIATVEGMFPKLAESAPCPCEVCVERRRMGN